MELNTDDNDLSILEFARRHHLSRPYNVDRPPAAWSLDQLKESDADPSNLLPIESLSRPPVDEKWTLTPHCARYLHSVMQPDEAMTSMTLDRKVKAIKQHKLDLPLLRTDPSADLAKFMTKAKRYTFRDYLDAAGPSESMSLFDNCLQWPLEEEQCVQQIEHDIKSDKLAVSVNTALYLRSITCISAPEELPDLNRRSCLRLSPARCPATMTPPLLPLSLSPRPYPSSPPDLGEPQLASTPCQTSNEFIELEGQLFADDLLDTTTQDAAAVDPETYLALSSGTSDMPHRKRKRSADFKLESPLLAFDDISSPLKKTKLIEQTLRQVVATMPPSPSPPRAATPDHDYNGFFDEIVDLAAPAQQALAEEHLQEADNAMRVQVPDVPNRPITAPWLVHSVSHMDYDAAQEFAGQARLLNILTNVLPQDVKRWKVTDQDRLCWNPIPVDHKCDVSEELVPLTGHIDDYIIEGLDSFRINDDMLLWKPDGLRILDLPAEENDEEVMTSSYTTTPVTETMVHTEPICWLSANVGQATGVANVAQAEPRALVHRDIVPALDGGSLFSASSALDTFMRIHSGRK